MENIREKKHSKPRLKRCEMCGEKRSLRNFQHQAGKRYPGQYEYGLSATGTKAPTKTCMLCGYIVLAERYDYHIQNLCSFRCDCGEFVTGATVIEYQKNRSSREIAEQIKLVKLSWKLMPQGEHPFSDIRKHYEKLQESEPKIQYQPERLDVIYALGPDSIYIGIDEFEGYIAFAFEKEQVTVLECPLLGNAIYVFKENWKVLSRLSKAELLNNHKERVQRIVHAGDWFQRIKALIVRP
jgi:hypothetical protein